MHAALKESTPPALGVRQRRGERCTGGYYFYLTGANGCTGTRFCKKMFLFTHLPKIIGLVWFGNVKQD